MERKEEKREKEEEGRGGGVYIGVWGAAHETKGQRDHGIKGQSEASTGRAVSRRA